MICNGRVIISDSKFSPATWAKIKSSGITVESGNVTIERSKFENLDIGLKLNEGTKNAVLHGLIFWIVSLEYKVVEAI